MKKILACLLFLCFLTLPLVSQRVVVRENDGCKEELRYNAENQLHGECLAWNQDGVLMAVANYDSGEKHGVWKIFYDNGQLAYEMRYEHGNKVGTWKHWNTSGELLHERNYGELLKS
jgi:antitoxin component YwqK of YwqJK toxin-antitoxin module